MSSFFTLLIIGISLSMDAFSLALVYGMSGITNKQKIIMSIVVGIYHFFMPLIGLQFGNLIDQIKFLSIDLIASIILVYLGIELIISNDKDNKNISMNIVGFMIFGLSVSIDSLTLGIGLNAITNNYLLSSCTFMVTSGLFTYLGLILGNIIGTKFGDYSKMVGGIVLIVLAIVLYFK